MKFDGTHQLPQKFITYPESIVETNRISGSFEQMFEETSKTFKHADGFEKFWLLQSEGYL